MSHATRIRQGLLTLAIAVALMPMGAATAEDLPSGGDVITNYITAVGGTDALNGVTSRKVKGTVSIIDMGLVMPMESYMSGGDYYSLTDVEMMGGQVLAGIKDGVVWQSHFMNGDAVLEGEEAADVQRQAAVNPYLNHEQFFSDISVTGEADVDGEAAYVVEQTAVVGSPSTAYFSKESGLLLKSEGIGGDGMPFTQIVGDYRDVGGILVAFSMEIQGMMTISIELDSVEFNVDIPAEQFNYPEVIANILNPPAPEPVAEEAAPDEGSEEKAVEVEASADEDAMEEGSENKDE